MKEHPWEIEQMINKSVFRSKHIPANDFEPAYEILEGQLLGLFKDKPILYEAANDAAIEKYQFHRKAIFDLYTYRKRLIDKKMKNYNIRILIEKKKYKKSELKKLKRQTSHESIREPSYKYAPSSEMVKDIW